MNEKMYELARIYGIDISDAQIGEGGLFFIDLQGEKVTLNDIFDTEDDTDMRLESVSFKNCSTYSTYSVITSFMLCAA